MSLSTSDRLSQLSALFDAGEIHATWAGLVPLLDSDLTEVERKRCTYLQLGCALYQVGDLDAARRLNRSLPLNQHTTLRYRLSLRLRDPLMAKRLRGAPGLGPQDEADFATSAGLYNLWRYRYRTGFALYQYRAGALNFGQILPRRLTYAPLPEVEDDDLDVIALEQGVGEVLFCLAHLKSLGGVERKHFLGEAKYKGLVAHVFPKAQFTAFSDLSDAWQGRKVHCAADFLARSFARNGNLKPAARLHTPTRGPFTRPAIGICWRAGSGQNRREERHIPLHLLLDQLPKNATYIPLQIDLTEAEQAILAKHPNCQAPIFDLKEDPLSTLRLVSQLAGVISVDSANWHFAGLSTVPLLALINETSHWFWGPQAQVEDTYPSAVTCPRAQLRPEIASDFVRGATEVFTQRPIRKPAAKSEFDRPLFILGAPRSGTSMTARIFAEHGFWFGNTVQGTSENKHGFFENRALRESYIKGILKWAGHDPAGVTSLPDLDHLPLYPHLRYQVRRVLAKEGYRNGPWALKDPKLSLIWPIFAEAFPEATWLIVHRDPAKVVQSLCTTSFMARHYTSPPYWQSFLQSYAARLERLRASNARVFDVSADEVASGEYTEIEKILDLHDLPFEMDCFEAAIDRSLLRT